MTTLQRLTATDIEQRLREQLLATELQVRDDSTLHVGHAGAREGGHFAVSLRSPRFEGLSRVARHRLVYHALGPLGPQGIHALSIDALAPGEP